MLIFATTCCVRKEEVEGKVHKRRTALQFINMLVCLLESRARKLFRKHRVCLMNLNIANAPKGDTTVMI